MTKEQLEDTRTGGSMFKEWIIRDGVLGTHHRRRDGAWVDFRPACQWHVPWPAPGKVVFASRDQLPDRRIEAPLVWDAERREWMAETPFGTVSAPDVPLPPTPEDLAEAALQASKERSAAAERNRKDAERWSDARRRAADQAEDLLGQIARGTVQLTHVERGKLARKSLAARRAAALEIISRLTGLSEFIADFGGTAIHRIFEPVVQALVAATTADREGANNH